MVGWFLQYFPSESGPNPFEDGSSYVLTLMTKRVTSFEKSGKVHALACANQEVTGSAFVLVLVQAYIFF